MNPPRPPIREPDHDTRLADARLTAAMTALDPAPGEIERLRGAALAAYDARPLSLTREWLDLVRVRPLAHTAYALAAAAALLLTTPLGLAGSSIAALLEKTAR